MIRGCGLTPSGPAGMRRLVVFLVLVVGLGWGCSGRERENPFDPLNDATRGAPAAAWAVAGCRSVELRWDPLGLRDRTGFRVWREVENAPGAPGSLLTLPALDAGVTSFRDSAMANGVLATYRLEFLFSGGAAAFAAPVSARPGSGFPWVGDPCGWGLTLLTPDGRRILTTRAAGSTILDLTVDAGAHRLLAASVSFPSGILVLPTDGVSPAETWSLDRPTCVSWSAEAGLLAVGSFYAQRIDWLDASGGVVEGAEVAGLLPEDVAMRNRGCTWLALADSSFSAGALLRFDLDAGSRDSVPVPLTRPVALADDPEGGGCWLADRSGALLYVRDDLSITRSAAGTLGEPTDVDSDGEGGCWVADLEGGALVRFDRQARETARISGLPGVRGVTVDPTTRQLWVTLPDAGEILLLRATGGSADTLGLGRVPGCAHKVAGDWTGACPATAR
ncbi:MAG: hypothetical protein KAY32_15045 [Candidatus Eisenbacteria sp.]|nr:hypothetical protein [Candidatus Eisenbacteria bacterium]